MQCEFMDGGLTIALPLVLQVLRLLLGGWKRPQEWHRVADENTDFDDDIYQTEYDGERVYAWVSLDAQAGDSCIMAGSIVAGITGSYARVLDVLNSENAVHRRASFFLQPQSEWLLCKLCVPVNGSAPEPALKEALMTEAARLYVQLLLKIRPLVAAQNNSNSQNETDAC